MRFATLAVELATTIYAREAILDGELVCLDGLYEWFTEGFDARDLIGAKALLGEL